MRRFGEVEVRRRIRGRMLSFTRPDLMIDIGSACGDWILSDSRESLLSFF
jgi:hypothetical protein